MTRCAKCQLSLISTDQQHRDAYCTQHHCANLRHEKSRKKCFFSSSIKRLFTPQHRSIARWKKFTVKSLSPSRVHAALDETSLSISVCRRQLHCSEALPHDDGRRMAIEKKVRRARKMVRWQRTHDTTQFCTESRTRPSWTAEFSASRLCGQLSSAFEQAWRLLDAWKLELTDFTFSVSRDDKQNSHWDGRAERSVEISVDLVVDLGRMSTLEFSAELNYHKNAVVWDCAAGKAGDCARHWLGVLEVGWSVILK